MALRATAIVILCAGPGLASEPVDVESSTQLARPVPPTPWGPGGFLGPGGLPGPGGLASSGGVSEPSGVQLDGGETAWQPKIGAFCPPLRANPLREASTFGVSALLMWALARRRASQATASGER
jgi:hypothetical protein